MLKELLNVILGLLPIALLLGLVTFLLGAGFTIGFMAPYVLSVLFIILALFSLYI